MKESYVYLAASLMVAFGGWAAHFSSWKEILEPSTCAGFIGTVGSILIAWVGKSPKVNGGLGEDTIRRIRNAVSGKEAK